MNATVEVKQEVVVMREYTQLAGNITIRLSQVFEDGEFKEYKAERITKNALQTFIKVERFGSRAKLDQAITAFRNWVMEVI